MDKMLALIKIDLNNTFGLSSLVYSFKKKKNRWQVVILALAALSLIPSYFLMIKALGKIYEAYGQIGQRSYFLQMGIFGSQLLVFVLGIIYVMSKYYFANDLEQLVPLPIKASHILGSKFVSLLVSEYLTSLPIILPFIFIYGLRGGEGPLYWIYSIFIVLTIPILPLIISSILVMVFMKYTNIRGKKDLLRIIASGLFIVLILYIQFTMQKLTQKAIGGGEEFYLNLVKDSNLLVKKLGLIFPPSMWASLSLANNKGISGIAYLVVLLSNSIVGYSLMIFLSERLFFDGLIGNIEVSVSKGRLKGRETVKELGGTKALKPYMALAKKEILMLMKTPVYFINSVAGSVIVPILLFMSIYTGDDTIDMVKGALKAYPKFLILPSIGLIVVQGAINSVASTTFSREGKSFWIQRVLPIRVEDQIIGRILGSLFPQILAIGALLVAESFIVKLRLLDILIIITVGLLGSIPIIQIGMTIDILRPLLTWDNPQKAMKQNLNVLISMGVASLYIGGLGYGVYRLTPKLGTNYIYILLSIVFIFTIIILFTILRKLISKQFIEIE